MGVIEEINGVGYVSHIKRSLHTNKGIYVPIKKNSMYIPFHQSRIQDFKWSWALSLWNPLMPLMRGSELGGGGYLMVS